MKFSLLLFSLFMTGSAAFTPLPSQSHAKETTLQAKKDSAMPNAVAAALVGLTIASQGAIAMPVVTSSPSMTVAALLDKKPDPVYERLDMSLPSYNAGTSAGFGDGTEAYLNGKQSSQESSLQKEAMLKAEAARKERLAEKKAEMKALEEEGKRRSLERKEENLRRLRGIFDEE